MRTWKPGCCSNHLMANFAEFCIHAIGVIADGSSSYVRLITWQLSRVSTSVISLFGCTSRGVPIRHIVTMTSIIAFGSFRDASDAALQWSWWLGPDLADLASATRPVAVLVSGWGCGDATTFNPTVPGEPAPHFSGALPQIESYAALCSMTCRWVAIVSVMLAWIGSKLLQLVSVITPVTAQPLIAIVPITQAAIRYATDRAPCRS